MFRKISTIFSILLFTFILMTSQIIAAESYATDSFNGRIDSGWNSRAVIDNNHNLFIWGYIGKNGDSDIITYTEPTKVLDNAEKVIIGNDLFGASWGAIKTDGSLWTWGDSKVLGNQTGKPEDNIKPVQKLDNVKNAYILNNKVAALKNDNTLWIWGEWDTSNKKDDWSYESILIEEPIKVADNVKDIAGNQYILKNDGTLWITDGRLNNNELTYSKVLDSVKSIDNGFITDDNKLYGIENSIPIEIGQNVLKRSDNLVLKTDHTLCKIVSSMKTDPIEIYLDPFDKDVIDLFDTDTYVKSDGSLWEKGTEYNSETYTTREFPKKILDNVASATKKTSGGLAITKDGKLYSWGVNGYGTLGNGTKEPESFSSKVYDPVELMSDLKPFDSTQEPDQPSEPDKPDQPSEPDQPSKPDQPSNPDQPTTEKAQVNRLYNKVSQEHLYTTDMNEVNTLTQSPDWINEGTGWIAPKTGDGVFRLHCAITGEHLYTKDINEVNDLESSGIWSVDNNHQPLFYSGGSVPIYRLYHEGIQMHHLTADQNEYETLRTSGWNDEGVKINCLGVN